MNKKQYIYFFLVGTFVLFMLLPLFNYSVDRWRVLHSDYGHYYAGQMSNKTFLKTKYLIEHPKKYDTILMGSSNGGYMDITKISTHTYNMKYNFGLLAIHVQNLKTMLENGVSIKNLWVGISDYVIWKDPKDYENSFERRPYKANLIEDMKTYMFYLFREPDMMDIFLLRGRYRLLDSNIILNPQPHLDAKKREERHLKIPKKWKEHMKNIEPSLLRYDDTTYRVDEVISEIQELKYLCQEYKINLKLFMYPVYYKTFLLYNQDKIEEFKRKLVTVIPFYDFYLLNERAYDSMKWQDGMHFAYSTGDFIIESIKNNKKAITENNIEEHVLKIKDEMKRQLNKHEGIVVVHPSIEFGDSQLLFDITSESKPYIIQKDLIIKSTQNNVDIHVIGSNPILLIPKISTSAKKVFLEMDIDSPYKTLFRIYYKASPKQNYMETNTFRKRLVKGKNKFKILLPSEYIRNGLRIDVARHMGMYKINKFFITE